MNFSRIRGFKSMMHVSIFGDSMEESGAEVMARESLELGKFLGLNLTIDKVTEGDGNCFYNALKQQLQKPSLSGLALPYVNLSPNGLRKAICDFVQNNKHHFKPFLGRDDPNLDALIRRQRMSGVYASEFFVEAASMLLNLELVIISEDLSTRGAPFVYHSPSNQTSKIFLLSKDTPCILLAHIRGNHFQSVILECDYQFDPNISDPNSQFCRQCLEVSKVTKDTNIFTLKCTHKFTSNTTLKRSYASVVKCSPKKSSSIPNKNFSNETANCSKMTSPPLKQPRRNICQTKNECKRNIKPCNISFSDSKHLSKTNDNIEILQVIENLLNQVSDTCDSNNISLLRNEGHKGLSYSENVLRDRCKNLGITYVAPAQYETVQETITRHKRLDDLCKCASSAGSYPSYVRTSRYVTTENALKARCEALDILYESPAQDEDKNVTSCRRQRLNRLCRLASKLKPTKNVNIQISSSANSASSSNIVASVAYESTNNLSKYSRPEDNGDDDIDFSISAAKVENKSMTLPILVSTDAQNIIDIDMSDDEESNTDLMTKAEKNLSMRCAKFNVPYEKPNRSETQNDVLKRRKKLNQRCATAHN